jgi:hypothetical protein
LLYERDQPLPGVRDEPAVKAPVWLLPCVDVDAGGCVHFLESPVQLLELLRGQARNGCPDCQSFVDDAHGVELLEVVHREVRDPDPSVELRLNEAFALEQSERLAHWSATDPEVLG